MPCGKRAGLAGSMRDFLNEGSNLKTISVVLLLFAATVAAQDQQAPMDPDMAMPMAVMKPEMADKTIMKPDMAMPMPMAVMKPDMAMPMPMAVMKPDMAMPMDMPMAVMKPETADKTIMKPGMAMPMDMPMAVMKPEMADKTIMAAMGGMAADDQYDTSTLRLLHVIFRHGQRTPADTYPNDPYEKFGFDPVGWGQLTLKGKLDQYEQGQWMRRRYGSFLGDMYHPDVMTVQSTDVDRTKMSAMLAMAGLWPPAPEQRWHPSLDWQPVPIRSQPLDKDDFLLVRVPCARYGELLDEVMHSPEVEALMQENADMMKWLTKMTGLNITTPDDVQSLYSTLKAESDYNLTLPDWTREVYPHRLQHLTALSFEINAMTREMQKIKGGPMVKAIMEHNVQRAKGALEPAARRMYAYAGHDSSISNFLISMGAWDTQIPGYGILVLVELHEDPASHEYGVKLFLRNSTAVPPYPLEIRGCGHFCPLERLMQLTQDVIPDDLEQACVAKDPNYTPPPPSGP